MEHSQIKSFIQEETWRLLKINHHFLYIFNFLHLSEEMWCSSGFTDEPDFWSLRKPVSCFGLLLSIRAVNTLTAADGVTPELSSFLHQRAWTVGWPRGHKARALVVCIRVCEWLILTQDIRVLRLKVTFEALLATIAGKIDPFCLSVCQSVCVCNSRCLLKWPNVYFWGSDLPRMFRHPAWLAWSYLRLIHTKVMVSGGLVEKSWVIYLLYLHFDSFFFSFASLDFNRTSRAWVMQLASGLT